VIYLAHSPTHELRKGFSLADDGKLVEHKPDPGSVFEYERRKFASLEDAYALLNELADDPHRAIVMGRPLIERGRRKQELFEDVERRLWIIDLDGAPLDGAPQQAIEACLPFLIGHSYVYAHSQSAGLKEGLRCRIICELARPHKLVELQALARHYNSLFTAFGGIKRAIVDPKIYSREHFIFTARPRLTGIGDPHPVRVHIVRGDDQPVRLDVLPDMVEIVTKSNASISELPALEGFGREGVGLGRNLHAYHALRRLRSYMERSDNRHNWESPDDTGNLWHQMLDNAKATEYEWGRYADYHLKRRKKLKPADTEDSVLAIANPDRSIPLDQAEKRLAAVMRAAVQSSEPRVTAIKVTMGTGKTRQALIEIGREMQKRIADSPQFGQLFVDWYTPTVETGEQTLATAEVFGIDAFYEYGRGQEVGGRPVCYKHEAESIIAPLVGNTAQAICHNKDGQRCPHYFGCRWQWQRNDTQAIPLRIRAHHYLPHIVRSENHHAHRDIDLVVIDEDFCQALTRTGYKVSIPDLVNPARGLPPDAFAWVQRFGAVIHEGLCLERLTAAGFTEEVCAMLIKAEEALAPEIDINPAMSADASLKSAQGLDSQWLTYVRVWRRLRDCIRSGSMNRITHPAGQDFLVLNWRTEIKSIPWDHEANRPKVPVIVMSGTMDRQVLEQFLPVDEWHEIDVAPHPDSHIRQSNLRGSKSECLYGSSPERVAAGEDDEDKRAEAAAVRKLVKDTAEGSVLITYKEFEELEGAHGHFRPRKGVTTSPGRI